VFVGVTALGERIVVVEDDPTIAQAIAERLKAAGYEVTLVADGLVAVDVIAAQHPSLVILDLGLPGLDGIEVCRRIQRDRPVPVLMLTARDDETDMLIGLGVGADDYLTKPFSPRELVARIGAILRRSRSSTIDTDPIVRVGTLTIDPARRIVERDEQPVALTPREFDLLHGLAIAHGAVRSRLQLLADVWGHRDGYTDRTVDSHVRSVRRKLGDDIIRTVHGVGYAIGDVV
jgi:DNA-binding response OmpR family regulator